MALQRIQFADDALGTNTYTLTYNPISIVAPTDDVGITTVHEIIDGSNLRLTGVDNQTYQLIWQGWKHDDISSMISQLESFVYDPTLNNTKYIRFGDIGTRLGIFTSWTQVKIYKLTKEFRPGSVFVYEKLILPFEKVI